MDTGLLLPLAVFALTLAVSPGGATTLATSSGAQFGFRRSITLMVGISAGLAALAAIAGAGLSGLLMAVPSLQLAMKVIGTAYLLRLAWKIGNSGPPNLLANMTNPLGFAAGVVLLWVNPKAWAMVTGAAAAFAGLTSHPVELAAVLGIAFGLAAAVSQSIWCVAGILLAKLLKTERQWRAVNTTLGVLLAASTIPIWLT